MTLLWRQSFLPVFIILSCSVLLKHPVHGTCVDAGGSADCSAWQAAGDCVNNPAYMFSQCALSCQSTCLCPQFVPAGLNADRNCYCGYWATLGHCDTNPTLRSVHCQSSCNLVDTIDCGQPPAVVGADQIFTSTNWGSNVTYTCSTGYDQTGGDAGLRVCTQSGAWVQLWYGSGVDPVCTVRSCGAAPVVDGTTMNVTGINYQDRVIYTCADMTATMSGSDTITCQADSTWSQTPTCTSQGTANPVVVFITVPMLILLTAGVIILGFYLHNICSTRRTPSLNRINDVNSSQVSLVSHS